MNAPLPDQHLPFVVSDILHLPSPRSCHPNSRHCSDASSSSTTISEFFSPAEHSPSIDSAASTASPMLIDYEPMSQLSGVFDMDSTGTWAGDESEFALPIPNFTRLRSEVAKEDDSFFELPRRSRTISQRSALLHRESRESVDDSSTNPIVVDPKLYVPISFEDQLNGGYVPELPVVDASKRKFGQLLTITAETLHAYMQTEAATERLLIVDCRFEYEFVGGHIAGALNLCDPSKLEETFFRDTETVELLMKRRV